MSPKSEGRTIEVDHRAGGFLEIHPLAREVPGQLRTEGLMAHQRKDFRRGRLHQLGPQPVLGNLRPAFGHEPLPIANRKTLCGGFLETHQGFRSPFVGAADGPGGQIAAAHQPFHGGAGLFPALCGERPLGIWNIALGVFGDAVAD